MGSITIESIKSDKYWSKVESPESAKKAVELYATNHKKWLSFYKKYKPEAHNRVKSLGNIKNAYQDYLTDITIEINDYLPSDKNKSTDWHGNTITSNHIHSRFKRSNYTDFFEFFIATGKSLDNGTFVEWLDYQIEYKSGSLCRLSLIWDKYQEDVFDGNFKSAVKKLESSDMATNDVFARAYVAAAYPDLKYDNFEDVEEMILAKNGHNKLEKTVEVSEGKTVNDIMKSKLQAFPVINRKMGRADNMEEAEEVYNSWWATTLIELTSATDFTMEYSRKVNVAPQSQEDIDSIRSMSKPSFKKELVVGIDNIGESLKNLALFKCINNMVVIRSGQSAEKWGSGPGFISSKKYGKAGTKDASSKTKGFNHLSDGIIKA